MKVSLRACVLAIVLVPQLPASEASRVAKRAHKAEKAGQVAKAYLLYSEAAGLQPDRKKYRLRADALSSRAALQSRSPTPGPDADVSIAEPDEVFDSLTARELASAREPLPLPELKANAGTFDIDITGDSKSLFDQLAKLFGLDTVYDGDYEPGRPIRFRLTGADYREALHGLEAVTNSVVIPLSPKLFMVAKDTPQKRTDLEQTVTVTVPIPQIFTTPELVELAQGIKQLMGVQKLAWDTKSGAIVMRDRASRVLPAQALLRDLFASRPEVLVELELIEIHDSDLLNAGLNLPKMLTAAYQQAARSTTATTAAVNTVNPFPFGSRTFSLIMQAIQAGGNPTNLLPGLFPNSLSLYTVSIAEAQALANFSRSLGRNLIKSEIRALDSQAATFHIGDKYPILTGSYSVGTSVGSQYVPPPSFTFEDLGITLKVTPRVHGLEEVSLDVESEFKLLTGQTVNDLPVISNRKLKAMVRLKSDETGLIAGLVSRSNSRTVTGVWGLSSIPWIGKLFSTVTINKDRSELLIVMRPRILGLPANQTVTRAWRVGSEGKPLNPL